MKKKPLKTCPECGIKCHARKATCECGYVFYEKRTEIKLLKIGQPCEKAMSLDLLVATAPTGKTHILGNGFTWVLTASLLSRM